MFSYNKSTFKHVIFSCEYKIYFFSVHFMTKFCRFLLNMGVIKILLKFKQQ